MNEKRYRAVLFDLGGTLRIALEDEPYMRHARRKMTELAGAPLQVEDFYQLVEDRYESYRRWALGENKEAGDRELWCRWLLPDYDQKRIAQVCHELSFEYRQSKGRRVVVDGGAEVIRTLHERGYKLGIVSNLIGEHEVPDWLEEDRLAPYFDSVVLSSVNSTGCFFSGDRKMMLQPIPAALAPGISRLMLSATETQSARSTPSSRAAMW